MSTTKTTESSSLITMLALALLTTGLWLGLSTSVAIEVEPEPEFTTDFRLQDCQFKIDGVNPYFILKPHYHLLLEGEDEGEEVRVLITVLTETEDIILTDGRKIKTRVVQEMEWVDGELVEVSRNFFGICKNTNSVFYFGEDVDIFEDGELVSHDGAWRAGVDGAMPGILMPGTFLLGSLYFQEIAPGIALDQAENVAMGLTIETDASTFEDCVEVLETTPLEPGEESTKIYCRGVGLIVDDEIELVSFGFGAPDLDD